MVELILQISLKLHWIPILAVSGKTYGALINLLLKVASADVPVAAFGDFN